MITVQKKTDEVDYRSHFWKKIHTELGLGVPNHIKNIMQFNNLDNPFSFRQITDDIISELEVFARTSMIKFLDISTTDLNNYFGIYHRNPEDFRFVIGDKLLIKLLVQFVQSKLWTIGASVSRPIKQQHQVTLPDISIQKLRSRSCNKK